MCAHAMADIGDVGEDDPSAHTRHASNVGESATYE